MNKNSIQKIYSSLLAFGALILLFRTIKLAYFEEGLIRLSIIPIILLYIELVSDICCFITSLVWNIKQSIIFRTLALYIGACSTILHLFRVVIFALSRTAVLNDFDLKDQYKGKSEIDEFWVYFALIFSIIGIIGLIIIYLKNRSNKKTDKKKNKKGLTTAST